jgi:hypothetical protein
MITRDTRKRYVDLHTYNDTALKVAEKLTNATKQLVEAYGVKPEDVKFEIVDEDDWNSSYVQVSCYTPETDEEYEARKRHIEGMTARNIEEAEKLLKNMGYKVEKEG